MGIKSPGPELSFAVQCAMTAGSIQMEYYEKAHRREWKSETDFKTEVDDRCDALIRENIHQRFPNDTIYSEETATYSGTSTRSWVVDPLDGTFMYEAGIGDQFGVAIALEIRNEPILGVLYFPKRDELYTAEKGQGAFCNGDPIRVSGLNNLRQVKMGVNHGKLGRGRLLRPLKKLWAKDGVTVCILLACATAPLAFTAAGRLHAYMAIGLEPWDMAAAVIIIREAGGKVTHLNGEEWELGDDPSILAANPALHQKLLDFLR